MSDTILYHEKILHNFITAIETENSVKTIQFQQNATIQGRISTHQVDAYWEFTDGDITYKTIIQVNGWDKVVSNAEMYRFVLLLRDIPGQVTGVLFTQPVYEKRIKDMAQDAGVVLYEIKIPSDSQSIWEPSVENVRINVDTDWVRNEKERLGLQNELIQVGGNPKYLYIYDEAGNCIDSVQGVFDTYVKKNRGNYQLDKQEIIHTFAGEAFLQTDNELFPLVKLLNITFDLSFVDSTELEGEELVQNILGSVLKFYSR